MTTSSSVDESGANVAPHESLVLGVDGGGTKTLAWLARMDDRDVPQVIGRGVAGSSNSVAVGWEIASDNLTRAIDHSFAAAQLKRRPVRAAVLALAGSGSPEVRQQVSEFIVKHLSVNSVRVVHDGQAVLQAGTPDGWGIALIAGTGAVAYGINPTGQTAVVGGWGYWFGDEGSAYWLGQQALRAVAQSDDRRANQTALTTVVLSRLGVQQPREILAALTAQGDVRFAIADLAELVCVSAQQQDEVAGRIVARAVQHWSRHIVCLAQRLMLGKPFPLALAGGVLCGSEFARDKLLSQLQFDQVEPATVELVPEPVIGCLQLACRDERDSTCEPPNHRPSAINGS